MSSSISEKSRSRRDSIAIHLPGQARSQGEFDVLGFEDIIRRSASAHNTWAGTVIGLVTAGEDSQGMNPVIRAVVRMASYLGCSVMYIKNGFKGMVDGGLNFTEATWASTAHLAGHAGTILKTSKCPEFTERSARLKAAKNLVEMEINHVIAIGGDGTLKGVHLLQKEWIGLLRELDEKQLVDKERLQAARHLKVVGIVTSIVNDLCGTDMSIGANSATHRILEAVDNITTNASSSQTAFIIEVKGRHSGYLALAVGVACDASMVFIPEWPPQGNWKDELYNKVRDDRFMGLDTFLILKSEGATDIEGRKIYNDDIVNVLQEKLNISCKVTVLGNVQSGGTPSAYDRLLGTRMGAEAVKALKDVPKDFGPCVIGIHGNEITWVSLDACLEKTKLLEKHLQDKHFCDAVRLRGKLFQLLLSSYVILHSMRSSPSIDHTFVSGIRRVGIIQVGRASMGQCIVTKAFVGYCQNRGYNILGIKDGFEGLLKKSFVPLSWDQVKDWSSKVNDCLGSTRLPASAHGLDKINDAMAHINLCGLMILGSFPAFESLCEFYEARHKYRYLGIPMCMVPVSVLNNIPGTEVGVGSDSALNELVSYCDKMRQVAKANKNYVYIIETMGQNCGYLTTMCAVCVGADAAYIKQDPFTLDTLLEDAKHIKTKISRSGERNALVLISECGNELYNTEFVHKLFSEEGKGVFSTRSGAMGQVQLGVLPSPLDRQNATIQGLRCGEFLLQTIESITPNAEDIVFDPSPRSKVVLCNSKRTLQFKTAARLMCEADFQLKIPTYNWWMKLRPLMRIMTEHFDENLKEDDSRDDVSTSSELEATNMFDVIDTHN